MNTRRVILGLPVIACLLACSIVNLLYFPATTIFPDEQRFLASAIKLATSGEFWVGSDRAWEMPGTALFYAPAVWLFGSHAAIMSIRFAQSILLAMQCGLVAFIARLIFDKVQVVFIASCIMALYPFFLFYQGLLLSETLFNTLLLAGIAAMYWWRERGLQIDRALVAACLCFAAATLTKATLTILPPLLIAATAWLAGANWRRTFTILLATSCLFGAFMSPWWIRNAAIFHTFVPFTTGSAVNLYVGNNSHNRDAGIDWASDVEPDVFARINALPDELERQRAFSKAAVDYIETDPVAFLRLAAKKFIRFWNVFPNTVEFQSRAYFTISALSFGPILALALLCTAWHWRQWRLLAPLYIIVGYFTFVHIISIASLRYRLPLEPLLIILAAEPIGKLFDKIRQSTTHPVRAGRDQTKF